MANLLEQLGQGLRSGLRVAGAGLSPRVYESQEREREQFEQVKAQRAEMIVQMAARAAENGSITPDAFQRIAQKYGVEGAPAVGPSLPAQKVQLDILQTQDLERRRQQFRQGPSAPSAEPGRRAIPQGSEEVPLPPEEVSGERTLFDVYATRAEEATNLGLDDEAQRFTRLADLELKKRDKESSLKTLVRERDALPPNSPVRAQYDAAIAKETGGEGKGQVVDLGDRVIVIDPKKIGDVFSKGLTPKDAAKGPETLNQKEISEIESKLRDDFWQQVGKNFTSARDAHGRIQTAAKDPSAAGDLALIYSYMRLLDPTSVVRESEFAVAASTGSYGDRIKALVNKALDGERLSDAIRNDFVNRAESLYERERKNYENSTKRFRDISKRSGANPDNVLPAITSGGGPAAPSGKAYGTSKEIEDAYRAGKIKNKKELTDAYEKFYLENPGAE